MKRSKFTDEQILASVREGKAWADEEQVPGTPKPVNQTHRTRRECRRPHNARWYVHGAVHASQPTMVGTRSPDAASTRDQGHQGPGGGCLA